MSPAMFKHLSIHRKLVLLLMLASSTVLVVASVSYLAWDYVRFRDRIQLDLAVQAGLVLDNTSAALSFLDPEAAREALEMLAINPHVRMACLYLANGELFVETRFATDAAGTLCPAAAPPPGYRFLPNRIELTQHLARTDSGSGAVFIRADLGALSANLRAQGVATASILAGGLLLSFLLSSTLQRIVSRPIAQLAGTAKAITASEDYSLRATRTTRDELGVLVDAFNQMLDQIQSSERERAGLLVREQQANRLKDEFLATLSHELRTPLNAIVGWTHVLRTQRLDAAEMQRGLERIERNAHAQTRLVEDLLDVSRITTGKLQLEVRPMDLVAVSANAIDSCRPAAEARRVLIATQFPDAGCQTIGDPDRLQQVVWNLISNAVRFTPAGGSITVAIDCNPDFDVLTVTDTGAGIDAAFLPFVFEPFRQADAASTRQHGGLGMGLTIVRRLIEMHGGDVSVASDGPGRGARFTVRLPAHRQQAGVKGPVARSPREASSLQGARVLLVDDDADSLDLVGAILRAEGARVLTAASAEAALALAVTEPPDVLVTDIAMADQDGYMLLTSLRQRLGVSMPAATMALTAYASQGDRERIFAAGFKRHMPKPIDPVLLVETLQDLITEVAGRPGP
ncbi:MAG: ATP-binding protein [Vicinamibacterales bacterium]